MNVLVNLLARFQAIIFSLSRFFFDLQRLIIEMQIYDRLMKVLLLIGIMKFALFYN